MVKTICVECRYHSGVLPTDPWYSHKCNAPDAQLVGVLEPVSGLIVYGPGRADSQPYCRDINKGTCPHYQEKS